MRNMKMTFIGITLFLFLWSATGFAADVAKIGVVDFQRILETSSAGKASQAEINKHGKKMETDLKNKQAELQELKKKLEREALVMSREMRDEKERDFRIRLNDFKSIEKRYKQELAVLNKRLVKQMQGDVFNLVAELGKKEGYLLIVERLEGGVIYSPQTIDVTDQLIQIYNQKFAGKAAGAAGGQ